MHHPAFIRLAAGLFALSLSFAFSAGHVRAAPVLPSDRAVEQGPAIAVAVTVTAESAKTVFSVLLSKPVTAHAAVMERPDRVILDLPEVTFRLPTETGRKREGLISSFRYGLFAPGRSRVVMDLAQPALVSRIAVQSNPVDGASTLVVELTRADREAFRKAVAQSTTAAPKSGSSSSSSAAATRTASGLKKPCALERSSVWRRTANTAM